VASGGGQSIDQTATLAFNGTQFATLTVNGQTFTVDLARAAARTSGRAVRRSAAGRSAA
jgi:hypothetical protein